MSTQVSTKVAPSQSERFTAAVIKEFSSNNGAVKITPFQHKLCQNYFIKIDQTLKDLESKRVAKSEEYREPMPYTWEYVNLAKLSQEVIAFSSVELDPMQPNHLSVVPYKNTALGKWDMTLRIGYRGMEIKAKKYGLDIPTDVVVQLVYSTDTFKQFKKDRNNEVESYEFVINKNFNRGDVVGGFWYHDFEGSPTKNKLKVFSLKDIEKRKPKYASAEFWGGEKDKWEFDKAQGKNVKNGTESIEGWFEEMAEKTISRNAYNAITIDSKKIDDNYLTIMKNADDEQAAVVQNEVTANANKESLDFDEAEVIEPEVLQIESNAVSEEVLDQVEEPEKTNPELVDGPNF
jgi:recombination protein RecT